jgi:hypothetical protein
MGGRQVNVGRRPDGLIVEVAEPPKAAKTGAGGRYALPALLLMGLAARVGLTLLAAPDSDVYYYLKDAVSALLKGMNPYGINYTGIPSNLATPGVGHIFAYLPFTALYLVPFGLLGDVRSGMIAADLAVAILLYVYCGPRKLASATVYLLLPPTALFSTVYLNATLVAMVFIAAWLVLEARGRALEGAACLGLALASSQFSFFILPFSLVYYLRLGRWKEPLAAIGLAAAIAAPFVAAGPGAFLSETVTFELERGVAALYTTGAQTGFAFSPSMNAILLSAFGVSAPLYVKALIESILALALIRVRDLRSLVRSSFIFSLASVFILPNVLFWAYLELPFMLMLFWVGSPGKPETKQGARFSRFKAQERPRAVYGTDG